MLRVLRGGCSEELLIGDDVMDLVYYLNYHQAMNGKA